MKKQCACVEMIMFMYFNCIYIFIFISRLYIGVLVKSGSLGALNFFSFAYVFMI